MQFSPPACRQSPLAVPTPVPQWRAPARLTLRTVRRGAETIAWRRRAVRVDVDVYVVVGHDEPVVLGAEAQSESLSVEIDLGGDLDPTEADFTPATRPMTGAVGVAIAEAARERPLARRIRVNGAAAAALGTELVAEERALRARADRIACAKPATREALFRRLLLSADFIQSHFAEPLSVELLAAVSNLSPFHFARLFALVMDETPHAFLTRKRVAVARRLIDSGLERGDAAERAGFGCRSTLFRHLREAAAARS
jgi:AraC-like DNA-binding protein